MAQTDELKEHRERTLAAWRLIEADVVRLKEAVRAEVEHVKHINPKDIVSSYPLVVAGVAAGLGFVFGFRRGRRRGEIDAIAESVGAALPEAAKTSVQGKSLGRRVVETLLLGVVERAGQTMAARLVENFERSSLVERGLREGGAGLSLPSSEGHKTPPALLRPDAKLP